MCNEMVLIFEQCLGSADLPIAKVNAGAWLAQRTAADSGCSGCCFLRSEGPIRGATMRVLPLPKVPEATIAAAVCSSGWLSDFIAHTAWRRRLPFGRR
jgi:hypothetical protein